MNSGWLVYLAHTATPTTSKTLPTYTKAMRALLAAMSKSEGIAGGSGGIDGGGVSGGGVDGGGGEAGIGGDGGGGDGVDTCSTCDVTVALGLLTMKMELANQLLIMVAVVVPEMVVDAPDASAGVGKIMRTDAVTLDDWKVAAIESAVGNCALSLSRKSSRLKEARSPLMRKVHVTVAL